jgi:hypothetical protein
MSLKSGMKRAARVGSVVSAGMCLAAACLSAPLPNVVAFGATLVVAIGVLAVGAFKLLDRYLRFLEAMHRRESNRKRAKKGAKKGAKSGR